MQNPCRARRIILVGGDEEYRSEEALPMLASILSQRHGFETQTLLALDPATGKVSPECQTNIPGMEHLKSADLLVLFTRFRELPNEQMRHLDEYIEAGKPIIGLRTATHAFYYQRDPASPYAKYSFKSQTAGWEGGFGRRVLGETWVSHHGDHGAEGTRGLIDGTKAAADHPILRGVSDIWTPTDVYAVTTLNGDDADVLVWGAPTTGMTADTPINVTKSIMPVAWTKSYRGESGIAGRVFATTMGSSVDFLNEDLRRLVVNACYWALGLDNLVGERSDVTLHDDYAPSAFGFVGSQK